MKYIDNIILFFILILPTSLITGPAIPDILITLIGLLFIFNNFNNFKLIYKTYKIYTNIFFIIWIYLILNSFISFNPILSFERSVPFVRFYFFSLALNLVISKNYNFNLLIYAITIPLCFVCFDLIYQFIFLVDIFGFEPQHSNTRFQGPFNDEFIAGSYLSKLSLIPMALMFYRKNVFRYLFTFLIILSVLITGERMALILLLFGYFLISSIYDFKKSIIFSFVFVILLSFFTLKNQESIGYRLNDFKERVGYNYIIGKSDRSFFDYGHGAHFLTGYEIFKDYPIFGSGIKTFREVCNLDIYDDIPSLQKEVRCSTHPHNYYIEIISETGLIGMSIFLLSIIYLFKNNLFLKIKNTNQISLLPIFIFLFPIASTNSFFTNWISIIFFFILSFYKLKNN